MMYYTNEMMKRANVVKGEKLIKCEKGSVILLNRYGHPMQVFIQYFTQDRNLIVPIIASTAVKGFLFYYLDPSSDKIPPYYGSAVVNLHSGTHQLL